MRAKALGDQSIKLARTLHLLTDGPTGETHQVNVALCLGVDHEPYQVVGEQTLLDCRDADLVDLRDVFPRHYHILAQQTEMGDLPPYMLPTIIIDEIADYTLLSVSQACRGIISRLDSTHSPPSSPSSNLSVRAVRRQ
jgi:hypothetical protein